MCEEVANETVGVLLVHCEGVFETRTKNAWCEGLGESGDVCFICGGELDEAGEVCHESVEGGDVGEAELDECVLEDGDACRVGGF